MAIIGFSLLCVSSVLTVLAQLTRTHFFMAASSTFTLAGLCLGSSLIILVSAVSDEFNSTSVSQVEKSFNHTAQSSPLVPSFLPSLQRDCICIILSSLHFKSWPNNTKYSNYFFSFKQRFWWRARLSKWKIDCFHHQNSFDNIFVPSETFLPVQ